MRKLSTAERDRLRRFVARLKTSDDLASFLQAQNRVGEAFLFGGAPRDVVFSGAAIVNDLDIFVSGPLEVARELEGAKRTRFGGLRTRIGSFDVDVWRLEDSAAFRKSLVPLVGVKELLKTVCFSTDAIAVSTAERGSTVVLPVFLESLERKRIDFVREPERLEAVYCARIARLVLKLGLLPTPWVASYFIQGIEKFGVEGVLLSEQRWGDKMILNPIAIEEVRALIDNEIRKVVSVSGVIDSHLRQTRA